MQTNQTTKPQIEQGDDHSATVKHQLYFPGVSSTNEDLNSKLRSALAEGEIRINMLTGYHKKLVVAKETIKKVGCENRRGI